MHRLRPVAFVLLVGLTGCLPYSCQREASQALWPADSLSRRAAEAVAMDTLRRQWTATGPEEDALAFPRTVSFGPDGRLYVGDVERSTVLAFTPEGRFVQAVTAETFDVPYLAGWRGDTLVVFSPAAPRVDYVAGGRAVGGFDVAADLAARDALLYAAAGDTTVYLKAVGQETDGFVVRLGRDGRVLARRDVAAPYWRAAGFLRTWGDTLVSLSGFRPVVDVFSPDLSAPADTLALVGFDSPMLARSRSFMLGDVHEAPLLSPSAATDGDYLFALNLRAGWLRIDVFDRGGRLVRRLTEAEQGYDQRFFPQDLAVRRRTDGAYDVAVVYREPAPSLALYRWRGPRADAPERPSHAGLTEGP